LGSFTATCSFKSASSIAFNLALTAESSGVIGSLELHYPCEDEGCPARLRITLPAVCHGSIKSAVAELFAVLAIPADTHYEATRLVPSWTDHYFDRLEFNLSVPWLRICSSDDIGVYLSVLADNRLTAAVESETATLTDITAPLTRHRYDTRTLKQEHDQCRKKLDAFFHGLGAPVPFVDEVIKHFLAVNRQRAMFSDDVPFSTVESTAFDSKQQACETVPGSTHWWRFSSVGYDNFHQTALLHVDRIALNSPASAQRFFACLTRETPQWSLTATYPVSDERNA
jgi:hypothetical protein